MHSTHVSQTTSLPGLQVEFIGNLACKTLTLLPLSGRHGLQFCLVVCSNVGRLCNVICVGATQAQCLILAKIVHDSEHKYVNYKCITDIQVKHRRKK